MIVEVLDRLFAVVAVEWIAQAVANRPPAAEHCMLDSSGVEWGRRLHWRVEVDGTGLEGHSTMLWRQAEAGLWVVASEVAGFGAVAVDTSAAEGMHEPVGQDVESTTALHFGSADYDSPYSMSGSDGIAEAVCKFADLRDKQVDHADS